MKIRYRDDRIDTAQRGSQHPDIVAGDGVNVLDRPKWNQIGISGFVLWQPGPTVPGSDDHFIKQIIPLIQRTGPKDGYAVSFDENIGNLGAPA